MFVNGYQSKIHNIEEISDSSDPCMSFQMLWALVTMNPGNLRLGAVSLWLRLRCQDITEGHCNNKNVPSNCFYKVSVMLQIITVSFILVFGNYNSLSNTKHIVIFIKLSSYTKMTFLIQFLQYKTKDKLINSQYMTRNQHRLWSHFIQNMDLAHSSFWLGRTQLWSWVNITYRWHSQLNAVRGNT